LIYLEGQLKRLWRFEAPRHLKKQGVPVYYEGWMFDKRYEGQPVRHCLVFSELPDGIKIGDDVDYPIAFAGYLFKRYRVRAGKGVFDAPLLIGKTITLLPEQDSGPTTGEMRTGFLVAFFVIGGGTVALLVSLAWWYRRHDTLVRERLARSRPVEFNLPEDWSSPNGHPKN
jgi:hypothetical protein